MKVLRHFSFTAFLVLVLVSLAVPGLGGTLEQRDVQHQDPGSHHDHCEQPRSRHYKDTIFVTASAQHDDAVRLLASEGHPICVVRRDVPSRTGHWIVAPSDLDRREIAAKVGDAYANNRTVAVTRADDDTTAKLASVAGSTAWTSLGDAPEGAESPRPATDTLGILHDYPGDDNDQGEAHHAHFAAPDRPTRGGTSAEWLSAYFDTEPPPADPATSSSCSNPATCVTSLAKPKVFTANKSNSSGDAVTVTNTFYSLRSFSTGNDYYFLTNSASYTFGAASHTNVTLSGTLQAQAPDAIAVNVSPNQTECTDTLTHSSSYTVGYQAGISTSGGSGVLSDGSSYTSQQSEKCPDTLIFNESYGAGDTGWVSFFRTISGKVTSDTRTTYNSATYILPFESEPTTLSFNTSNFSTWGDQPNQSSVGVTLKGSSQTVDFPFPTTEPAAPTVDEVTPSSAEAGKSITLDGENFYANTIVAITLGGISVPQANIEFEDQTASSISFFLPSFPPLDTAVPVIVHTLYGLSDGSQTITRVASSP